LAVPEPKIVGSNLATVSSFKDAVLGNLILIAIVGITRMKLVNIKGPFLTSPLGANFDPQGLSCPPRGEFVP
jgi:hypothetical protein